MLHFGILAALLPQHAEPPSDLLKFASDRQQACNRTSVSERSQKFEDLLYWIVLLYCLEDQSGFMALALVWGCKIDQAYP